MESLYEKYVKPEQQYDAVKGNFPTRSEGGLEALLEPSLVFPLSHDYKKRAERA